MRTYKDKEHKWLIRAKKWNLFIWFYFKAEYDGKKKLSGSHTLWVQRKLSAAAQGTVWPLSVAVLSTKGNGTFTWPIHHTFKALLPKGQTFVPSQKVWPEVFLEMGAAFQIRLFPAESSFLHLPVNYVSAIVSSLKTLPIFGIMEAGCLLLLLFAFICGELHILPPHSFHPCFFLKKNLGHMPHRNAKCFNSFAPFLSGCHL